MTELKTSQRVKRSMVSMLIGRPISAVGGILVMVLLSRLMQQESYGIYFSVWALVEIAILWSNVGLIHAVYRYVGANIFGANKLVPYGPVGHLIFWRAISLLAISIGLQFVPTEIYSLVNLGYVKNYLGFVGVILFAEGLARFFEAIFDSMMCQGRSQITLVLRTIIRLLVLAWSAIYEGKLAIDRVVWIEVFATFAGALVGLIMIAWIYLRADRTKTEVQKTSIARMTRFALPAYFAQVFGTFYGVDILKIVLNSTSGLSSVALFGFAYSIGAVIQRYMPASLLAGVFRPLFVAAQTKEQSHKVLAQLIVLCSKLNWILIIPALIAVSALGELGMQLISGWKYPGVGIVLVWLIAGLLPIALHLTLSQYCLAIEDSVPALVATGAATLTLPLIIWLAHAQGALGAGVSFFLSELVWCVTCIFLILRNSDLRQSFAWGDSWVVLIYGLAASVVCNFLSKISYPISAICLVIMILLYVLLLVKIKFFTLQELDWLRAVLPKKLLPRN